jgi:hypothetical protein
MQIRTRRKCKDTITKMESSTIAYRDVVQQRLKMETLKRNKRKSERRFPLNSLYIPNTKRMNAEVECLFVCFLKQKSAIGDSTCQLSHMLEMPSS